MPLTVDQEELLCCHGLFVDAGGLSGHCLMANKMGEEGRRKSVAATELSLLSVAFRAVPRAARVRVQAEADEEDEGVRHHRHQRLLHLPDVLTRRGEISAYRVVG